LENEVCIVTGAARGIGATTAAFFARAGAFVAMLDVKDDLGEKAASALRDTGMTATYHHCDVTRLCEVEATIEVIAKKYGRLDVLFNTHRRRTTVYRAVVKSSQQRLDERTD